MNKERQGLVDILIRHARTYWAKRTALDTQVVGNEDVVRAEEEYHLATERLLCSALSLGEYDAQVHPIEKDE